MGFQYHHLEPRQLKWPRLLDNVRIRVALHTLTATQGYNKPPATPEWRIELRESFSYGDLGQGYVILYLSNQTSQENCQKYYYHNVLIIIATVQFLLFPIATTERRSHVMNLRAFAILVNLVPYSRCYLSHVSRERNYHRSRFDTRGSSPILMRWERDFYFLTRTSHFESTIKLILGPSLEGFLSIPLIVGDPDPDLYRVHNAQPHKKPPIEIEAPLQLFE